MSSANRYPSPDAASKGLSTPYRSALAAGAQAQHHKSAANAAANPEPRQQPTAGPAASSASPAAGPPLVGEPLELDPELMDAQQRWACENGVLIVERPTTTNARAEMDALRIERPQLRWEYMGMGVFFGFARKEGEVEKVEVVSDFESEFDREFEAIMKGRQRSLLTG
ncbi:MAG: hypothetical protein Q9228_006046 [Teloschistes exilis]